MIQHPLICREVNQITCLSVVQKRRSGDPFAMAENFAVSTNAAFDALHRRNVKFVYVHVGTLEYFQSLPNTFDGSGKDIRRKRNGYVPMWIEWAEFDPGRIGFRGHVQDGSSGIGAFQRF